jgi:hypothetical protein
MLTQPLRATGMLATEMESGAISGATVLWTRRRLLRTRAVLHTTSDAGDPYGEHKSGGFFSAV